MDRIVNYIYNFVRDIPNTTFIIIMGIIATLGFYFFSLFLKANKKDSTKISKPSYLLSAILFIVIVIVLTNIRY